MRPLHECSRIVSTKVVFALLNSRNFTIFCAIGCVWFTRNCFVKEGAFVFFVLLYEIPRESNARAIDAASQGETATPVSSFICLSKISSRFFKSFLTNSALSMSTRTPFVFMSSRHGRRLDSSSKMLLTSSLIISGRSLSQRRRVTAASCSA